MEKIISKLISSGYQEFAAKTTAHELLQIDNSLNTALSSWLETGIETDMTIEEITLSELKSKYNMSYPAALLSMDWLLKEPPVAKAALTKGIK